VLPETSIPATKTSAADVLMDTAEEVFVGIYKFRTTKKRKEKKILKEEWG
jgi:hypothetical protein